MPTWLEGLCLFTLMHVALMFYSFRIIDWYGRRISRGIGARTLAAFWVFAGAVLLHGLAIHAMLGLAYTLPVGKEYRLPLVLVIAVVYVVGLLGWAIMLLVNYRALGSLAARKKTLIQDYLVFGASYIAALIGSNAFEAQNRMEVVVYVFVAQTLGAVIFADVTAIVEMDPFARAVSFGGFLLLFVMPPTAAALLIAWFYWRRVHIQTQAASVAIK